MADRRAVLGAITLALAAPVAPRGCGGAVVREAKPLPAECADDERVYGACVGVPDAPLCASDPCVGDVACTRVVVIADDEQLAAAVADASPGTCLALRPGDYAEVALPTGVSLLGAGAAMVLVRGVLLVGGNGSSIRGITVGDGGIEIDAARGVRIDAVRVVGSSAVGLDLKNGASLTLARSEVLAAGHFGISVSAGAELAVTSSMVAGAESGGVVVSCDEGCACSAAGGVDLDRVLLKDNHSVGLWVWGARATVRRLVVDGSLVDRYFEGGAGVVASECADIELRQATLAGCTGRGIFVHHSTASVGGSDIADAVEIAGAAGGVWIQNIATAQQQQVRLERVRILGSLGVGVVVTGHSSSVVLRAVEVSETALRALPEPQPGGVIEVGDGVVWADRSFVDVEQLTVSASARASFLIDGEVAAGSRVADVTLSGGDASKGIVQQRCPSWGTSPESGPDTPPIERTEEEVYPLPWE